MTSQLEEKTEIKGLCLICLRGPMRIDERRMYHTSLSFLPLLQLCSVPGGVIGNQSLSVRVVGGALLSSQTSLPPFFFLFQNTR